MKPDILNVHDVNDAISLHAITHTMKGRIGFYIVRSPSLLNSPLPASILGNLHEGEIDKTGSVFVEGSLALRKTKLNSTHLFIQRWTMYNMKTNSPMTFSLNLTHKLC